MPTSRRPGPGDRPRRPRVAGTRKRTMPAGNGVMDGNTAEIAEAAAEVANSTTVVAGNHRSYNGLELETKAADPAKAESADDPDPTAETANLGGTPIIGLEATTAAATDDTDVVADAMSEAAETDRIQDAEPDRTEQDVPAETTWVETQGRTVRQALTVVLLLLTVVCGALSFWFFSKVDALRNEGPAANHALIDPAPTSEVNGKISSAVQQVFSYDFADTAKADNAAKNLLVGPAIQQYNQLYEVVKSLAPQQKLVLTTTVQASAVTMLQGDRAQLLLIVDQNDTRTDIGQSSSFTGQLSIGAVKQGNDWKIDQITQI